MSTLDVVAEVLRAVAPRALNARQIVELSAGRLPTASRTPETVVSRDLALDVKKHRAASKFLRVDRGEFVLKHVLPTVLYNDNDEYAARWSQRLVAAGELPHGIVDQRSIKNLTPADVAGYRQFHAFSGLGTWARALRDAGWPEEWPVWSGSSPCQGMSQAGKRLGFADPRHLWPDWFRLIDAVRPPFIFGEQVASKDGLAWLDLVLTQLGRADYSVGAIDTCAAGYGAPHLRQRLYFVAVSREGGWPLLRTTRLHDLGQSRHDAPRCSAPDRGASIERTRSSELGDSGGDGVGEHSRELSRDEGQHEEWPAQGDHASVTASATHGSSADQSGGDTRELVRGADAITAGDVGRGGRSFRPGDRIRIVDDPTWGGSVGGYWDRDVEWVYCRPAPGHQDGCFRPARSCTPVLVDGTSSKLGGSRAKRLRSIGNAIVLPQAAEFVRASIDMLCDFSAQPRDVGEPQLSTAWTGPLPGETAPSGLLYGRVPGDRWPHGPPSAHAPACNLFPHRGSPGGLYCDCAASATAEQAGA